MVNCYFCGKKLNKYKVMEYRDPIGNVLYYRPICNDCVFIVKLMRREFEANRKLVIQNIGSFVGCRIKNKAEKFIEPTNHLTLRSDFNYSPYRSVPEASRPVCRGVPVSSSSFYRQRYGHPPVFTPTGNNYLPPFPREEIHEEMLRTILPISDLTHETREEIDSHIEMVRIRSEQLEREAIIRENFRRSQIERVDRAISRSGRFLRFITRRGRD